MKLESKAAAEVAEKNTERRILKEHPLLTASPRQVERWVDRNVTDLESAKDAIKVIAKIIALKL